MNNATILKDIDFAFKNHNYLNYILLSCSLTLITIWTKVEYTENTFKTIPKQNEII